MTKSTIAKVLLVAWGLATVFLTLTPQSAATRFPSPFCIWCGDYPLVDAALNFALFAPLGFGLALWGRFGEKAWYAGFVVSGAIEALQFVAIPGRDASISDLVSNGLGSAAGAYLAFHGVALLRPTADNARRYALRALLLLAAVGAIVPWLLVPVVTPQPHYVQWQQQKGGFAEFGGQLVRLWVNDGEVTAGQRLAPPIQAPERGASSAPVRAEVLDSTAGGSARRVAIIARLATADREAFLLGRAGRSLVYRTRLRAIDAGLRVPMAALPAVFGDSARVQVRASLERGRLALAGGTRHRELRLTAGLLWAFFLPRDWPILPWMQLATLVCVALLTLPAAYWWRRAPRDQRLAGLAAVAVLSWVASPLALGLPLPGVWDVAGALVGMLAARLVDAPRATAA